MLEINFIRGNQAKIKKAIANKGIDLDLDEFLKIDDERRALAQEVSRLREERNNFNKGVVKLSGAEREKAIEGIKTLSEDLSKIEANLKEIEEKWLEMAYLVPNIPSDDTPVGEDEKANREAEKWGEIPEFGFTPKSHVELGRELDLLDLQKGVRTSGFRGYYLKNEAAVLHMAILIYAFNKMREAGFEMMVPPTILREFALLGSGFFPFVRDDIYELSNTGKNEAGEPVGESLYLAGTSEPSILAYFAEAVLDETELPKKVCAISSCYRNEVGSYGKDTKGLFRIHEFAKVEQVVLCQDDFKESDGWLDKLKDYSAEILKDLNLPYRVMQIATGEMGAGKRKMYDLETWMPSRNGYGETHSDSNLTDWQSRRLNIKYKTKNGEKKYVHALNNTVIASPRILIAILENYQQKDGTVLIPKVLQPFCGFEKIGRKK